MKATLLLAVVVATVAVAAAAPMLEEHYKFLFSKFIKQHSKVYAQEELVYRYNVFKTNLDLIQMSNSKGLSYKLGMNEFGDLTRDEFKAQYLRLTPRQADYARGVVNVANLSTEALPAAVDWTKKNAVTPVKNQGQCGSCWSFSTTGSIEGIHAIKTGKLVSFSEQQLVDCSTKYGNQGCNGGLMDQGFEYVIANKGLCTEASYPYTAQDGTCKATSCSSAGTITGYKNVPANEDALAAAVAQQPVSVAVEADQLPWQFYLGGIIPASQCGTNLDHGVLAVGYGSSSSGDYWLVKNSWGASWGYSGYVLLQKGAGGVGACGIASQASFPTLD